MKSIGNRMSKMIASKQVAISPEVFKKYFSEIFPHADSFLCLLQPHNSERFVDEAKKLFERLAFSLQCPEPLDFPLALLSMESKNFETSDVYFAQDHFVHSVYLYILGIYLFFNHQGFHQMIIEQTSITKCDNSKAYTQPEKVREFVRNWKYFSLYHDIGYIFEKSIEKDGSISSASTLSSQFYSAFMDFDHAIAYDLTIKAFSRFIIYSCIRARSTDTLQDLIINTLGNNHDLSCLEGFHCGEHREDSHIQDLRRLIADNESIANYKRLAYVHSYSDFRIIEPFFIERSYAVAILNLDSELCALKLCAKGHDVAYYNKKKLDMPIAHITNLETLELETGYTYAIFGDISDKAYKAHIKNLHLSPREDEIPTCIKTVYDSLGTIIRFSLAQGQLLDSHYNVYKKLKECVPHTKLSESYLAKVIIHEGKQVYKNFCDVIQNRANEILGKIPEESLLDETGLKQAMNMIKTGFKVLRCEDVSKEVTQLSARSDKKEDVLFHCIQTIYDRYINMLTWKPEDFSFADDRIVIKPFKYVEHENVSEEIRNLFQNGLKSIIQNLQKLSFLKADESIQQFLNYSIKYGYIDHGIASGALLSCIMSQYANLAHDNTSTLFTYAFSGSAEGIEASIQNEYAGVNSTSVFAILVHNIYGNRYFSECGNRYMQDVEINAFAYFAALCDNLQIWNRPHQYNPGIHNAPFSWFITESDIEVYDNLLYITCLTNNLQNTQKKLKEDLDEYLLGASELIRLSLTEVE